MRITATLACAFLFAGCGGGVVGDWFFCADTGCAGLGRSGMRFEADGVWVPLAAAGLEVTPEESYCQFNINGSYSVDGDVMTLTGISAAKLTEHGPGAEPAAPIPVGGEPCVGDEDCVQAPGGVCTTAKDCKYESMTPTATNPDDYVVDVRFSTAEDKMTFTLTDGGASVVLREMERQDALSCPLTVSF